MVIQIGIIGAGNIFPAYLSTLRKQRKVRIIGIADGQPAVAQARATEFGLTAMSVDELLASRAEIVLNITPPLAHHAVGMSVLNAGKHLFNEKPLAATFAQGQDLVALAATKQLRLGCAPDTVVAQLRFVAGAEVSLTVSFDVWKHGHAPIELYGEQGTILGHDPNLFGGKVRWSKEDGEWQIVHERRPYTANSRGIGLLDMALAIEQGRPHRCNEALALHVLEVMDKSLESAAHGRALTLATTCERPAPLTARLS